MPPPPALGGHCPSGSTQVTDGEAEAASATRAPASTSDVTRRSQTRDIEGGWGRESQPGSGTSPSPLPGKVPEASARERQEVREFCLGEGFAFLLTAAAEPRAEGAYGRPRGRLQAGSRIHGLCLKAQQVGPDLQVLGPRAQDVRRPGSGLR